MSLKDSELSPEARAKKREGTKLYLRAKPNEYHMWARAKDRAKKAGQPFDIEVSDVVTPSHCPYLGIPLFKGKGRQSDNSPSIDRIDPKKGYVKGNIEVISNKANAMKYNATVEEQIAFAKEVLRRCT